MTTVHGPHSFVLLGFSVFFGSPNWVLEATCISSRPSQGYCFVSGAVAVLGVRTGGGSDQVSSTIPWLCLLSGPRGTIPYVLDPDRD